MGVRNQPPLPLPAWFLQYNYPTVNLRVVGWTWDGIDIFQTLVFKLRYNSIIYWISFKFILI